MISPFYDYAGFAFYCCEELSSLTLIHIDDFRRFLDLQPSQRDVNVYQQFEA